MSKERTDRRTGKKKYSDWLKKGNLDPDGALQMLRTLGDYWDQLPVSLRDRLSELTETSGSGVISGDGTPILEMGLLSSETFSSWWENSSPEGLFSKIPEEGQRVFTKKGISYRLGKSVGRGGEGTVFQIRNQSGRVAKIYRKPVPEQEEKIKSLIDMGLESQVNGFWRGAFPEEILYDRNDRFIGFTMPMVESRLGLYRIFRTSPERERMFPGLNWHGMIAIAYNFASTVAYVHDKKMVIGDVSPMNFQISSNGSICLLDTDSLSFTDSSSGKFYPCRAAFLEILPPELSVLARQKKKISDYPFNYSTDVYSMAISLYRMLMQNQDPFVPGHAFHEKGRLPDPFQEEETDEGIPERRRKEALPLDILSDEVADLFRKSFVFDLQDPKKAQAMRPSAREWIKGLYDMYQMPVKQCGRIKFHVYLKHLAHCPFCERNI